MSFDEDPDTETGLNGVLYHLFPCEFTKRRKDALL